LVAVPLFFLLGLTRSFDFPKALLFRGLMLTALLLAMFPLLTRHSFQWRVERLWNQGSGWLGALFLLIFLGTVFSVAPLQSVHGTFERGQGLIQWGYYFVFTVILLLCLTKTSLQRTITALTISSGVIALYAIGQSLGWDPFFHMFDTDFFVGREFSTLGNPDFLGQYLGLIIPLAVGPLIWLKRPWQKAGVGTLILAMVWALFLSESRSPIFGMGVATLGVGLYLVVNHRHLIWAWVKRHSLALVVAGLALLAGFIHLVAAVGLEHIPLLNRFLFEAENMRSVISRLVIWQVATDIIWAHPFTGIGPEQFSSQFSQYIQPDFYRLEEDINISADRAHNDFLSYGLMAGIPGMVAYLGLIAWSLKTYVKQAKASLLTHVMFFSLFVYFGQNVFSFSETSHYLVWFFLLAGVITLTQPEKKLETLSFSRGTSLLLGIFALIVIPYAAIHTIWRPFISEAYYTGAVLYQSKDINTAYGYHKAAIDFYPYQTRLRYRLLMIYPQEIEPQLTAIRQIEGDTIDALAWQAVAASGYDKELAYELFEEAIALNPDYAHSQRTLADAYFREGQYELAIIYYENYLALVPEFWTWCPEIDSFSPEEQKTYRIFYKNVVIELMGMWLNEGKYKEVIEICDRLAKRDPDNNVVKLFRAKAVDMKKMDRVKKAINLLFSEEDYDVEQEEMSLFDRLKSMQEKQKDFQSEKYEDLDKTDVRHVLVNKALDAKLKEKEEEKKAKYVRTQEDIEREHDEYLSEEYEKESKKRTKETEEDDTLKDLQKESEDVIPEGLS
jgi:O-antigen ligase/tetratricopeptide (TPR) repeat protein